MKEQKITQDEFKNDTKIHIGRILCMQSNITIDTLEKIAEYLSVSTEDLIR